MPPFVLGSLRSEGKYNVFPITSSAGSHLQQPSGPLSVSKSFSSSLRILMVSMCTEMEEEAKAQDVTQIVCAHLSSSHIYDLVETCVKKAWRR